MKGAFVYDSGSKKLFYEDHLVNYLRNLLLLD